MRPTTPEQKAEVRRIYIEQHGARLRALRLERARPESEISQEEANQSLLAVLAGSRNDSNGCVLSNVGLMPGIGYIGVHVKGKQRYAHRLSWIAHNGPIPKGLQVCHKCDVRNCINPEHLFLGTPKQNMDDKTSKGRSNNPIGSRIGCSKLTEPQVEQIFSLRGLRTGIEVGRMFSVHHDTIYGIWKGKCWTHVSDNGPTEQLLTVLDVARRLGCSDAWVYKLVKLGQLEPRRMGRLIRFTRDSVNEFCLRRPSRRQRIEEFAEVEEVL